MTTLRKFATVVSALPTKLSYNYYIDKRKMKKYTFKLISIVLSFIFLFCFSACVSPQTNDEQPPSNPPVNPPSVYTVENEYFAHATFEKQIVSTTFPTTTTYLCTLSSYCSVSIYSYSAQIKFYTDFNLCFNTEKHTQFGEIPANTPFSFTLTISETDYINAENIEVTFEGESYENPSVPIRKNTVTFVYNNGTENSSKIVENGQSVAQPLHPKKENYIFAGWYRDKDFTQSYDFDTPVTTNLTLYAKFDLDIIKLTNTLTTDTMKGIVKVYNKNYNTFLGVETSSYTLYGSGVCFLKNNGYFYVLTNCHVAQKQKGYDKQKLTIEDYQGNVYEASLYRNANIDKKAIDATYELAVLCFKPASNSKIKTISLAKENPKVNDFVIALGSPEGQQNAITYGKINAYRKITLKDTPTYLSNVTFDVIDHDASVLGGSSGGPLLNENLKIIGINYASNGDTHHCAIPLEKVVEFLNKYFYAK